MNSRKFSFKILLILSLKFLITIFQVSYGWKLLFDDANLSNAGVVRPGKLINQCSISFTTWS
jgi:hypothetical protein